MERAIALSTETGMGYSKYQIAIPLRSFQPGLNKIRLMPRMMPLITGECQAIQTENLILTMYDDSIVRMPAASHFINMPNLRLLGRAGFPYTIKTDGAGAFVYVAAADSKTVAAAWTLLAKIAQRHAQPLHEAVISFVLPKKEDKDLLVVGPSGMIPAELLKGAPLEPGKVARIPQSVDALTPAKDTLRDWLEHFLPGHSRTLDVASAEGEVGKAVVVSQTSSLTGSALAMQYRSPFAAGRTATVFMAADENILLQGIGEIIKPEIWNDLQGNLVTWGKGAESVAWQKIGGDYTIGSVSVPTRVEFYFSRYPWIWIIVLLILTALLALITTRLLQHYRRKHHPQAPPVQHENE